ncbi:hypothetical protein EVAR_61131_1 [Eumeta japonica]|uniref:Reverse transcriptase domain-containing protein n=1 Tax=Eumeta variegata TaxID=151549 RepID=A0A4C2AEL6_EUMVA|nr:hypothetical protein EVAR_61131_1 [Eumeta japonica]
MVSLDIEGAFDNAWWPALRPSCPWLPGEPPWPGPRLPSGPGGRPSTLRGRQERDFRAMPERPRRRGSESGDREDHIHYRDRAYRSVRFALGHRRRGSSACERCSTLSSAASLWHAGSPYSPAFRAHPREAAPRYGEEGRAWLYEVKRGKDGDTFVDRELRDPYFGDLPHPAHARNRVRERRGPDPRRWTVSLSGRAFHRR